MILVETEIWRSIFRLARGEINVYNLVLELQGQFSTFDVESLSLMKNWFHPGLFFLSIITIIRFMTHADEHGHGDHISFQINHRTLMSFDVEGPIDPRWPMADRLVLNGVDHTSSVSLDKGKGKKVISDPTSNGEVDDDDDDAMHVDALLPPNTRSTSRPSMDMDEPSDMTSVTSTRSSSRIKNRPPQKTENLPTLTSTVQKKRKKSTHRNASLVLGVENHQPSINSTAAGTVIYNPIIIEDLEVSHDHL
jgi:hypothetical protein